MLLYYITDRESLAGTEAQQCSALLSRIADAASGGVDYIQLREKNLSPRELERLARNAVRAVRLSSTTTKLLINGRADVALAVGADGVHLPSGELAASELRALWTRCKGGQPLIGVSAHLNADILEAETQGADFAVLAPIFEKVQTSTPGVGLDALRTACRGLQQSDNAEAVARFPVLALGGVTLSNAWACAEAGAAGVAGIRLFQQGNVFETVKRLREL
ncbi:MAG TPA: thiamine phosphate synthase [Terriglobales bacterium]|nr:thiamine phosphate synthase [Terriglobales bacterium]